MDRRLTMHRPFVVMAALPLGASAFFAVSPALGQDQSGPAIALPLPGTTAGEVPTSSYPAEFFAQFAPRNALDMILRVPGFSLKAGNPEVRGFAQAAGNVVINGQRPSAKSDSLVELLQRIPTDRVVRIEVWPGTHFGADYAGEIQVANVVLSSVDGVSGSTNAALERNYAGRFAFSGDAAVSWVTERHTFGLSSSYQNGVYDEEGIGRVFTPQDRVNPTAERTNRVVIDEPKKSATVNYAFDGKTLDSAHLNLKYTQSDLAYDELGSAEIFGATVRDRFVSDYDTSEFEIGGDATFAMLGGSLEAVALHTRRKRRFDDSFAFDVDSPVRDGFSQSLDDDRTETIGRVSYSRSVFGGASLQLGAETARNVLESSVDLIDLGSGERIDLPVDDATVAEDRFEGFVTLGFAVTRRLRAEAGLRYEHSSLSVTGDAEAQRTLSFWKPNVSLAWDAPEDTTFQLSVERTVAQLKFEDFISFAELKDDQINGGNAELLPERTWVVKLTGERALLGDGIARITFEYNRISLLQDRVPVPGGFDAPGNIGTGTLWAIDGTLEVPLAKIGIAGGRLSMQSSILLTSVEDPYTMEMRRFSGVPVASVNIGFRKDNRKSAWGVELAGTSQATIYRRDELDTTLARFPTVYAFYQFRPDKVSSLTFSIDNLTDISSRRRRTFFEPDRAEENPVLLQFRETRSHIVPRLSYKRSF